MDAIDINIDINIKPTDHPVNHTNSEESYRHNDDSEVIAISVRRP